MQPYLFPYVGYFSLIASVDRFVFYDDVAFIKQGWINRNRILVNGEPLMFSVPIRNASSHRHINETEIDGKQFAHWRSKFLKTLSQAYRKAPCTDAMMPVVEKVLKAEPRTIAELARASVLEIAAYLGLSASFVHSSSIYGNAALNGATRVLDICKLEGAKCYHNPEAGRELYDPREFLNQGVILKFIQARFIPYPQLDGDFVPWLSILDLLMFNTAEAARTLLAEYDLA
jgi:hypothetical protein